MKKHYLVTGGGGFIGSNIVKMLIKRGNKVSVFDNFQRGNPTRLNDFGKLFILLSPTTPHPIKPILIFFLIIYFDFFLKYKHHCLLSF